MLTLAVYVIIVLFLLRIVWIDFRELRIPNVDVLILIGLYLVFAATTGFAGWHLDLIAGAAMFGLGFLFWLLGLMGAGDAKLYFPLGLLCGLTGLFLFVVLLSVASLAFFVILFIGGQLNLSRPYFFARLAEIWQTRKVPYSVPMVASLIVVLTWRVGLLS